MARTETRTIPVAALRHPCVRCGAPVDPDVALCERCNPLGLADPAASQVHGTVLLVLGIAVLGLAVLARLAVAGVGPFEARVANVAADPPALVVTLSVHNAGTAAGRTTCRIFDPTEAGIGPQAAFVQTPIVRPGETVSFSKVVTELGPEARPLAVECTSP